MPVLMNRASWWTVILSCAVLGLGGAARADSAAVDRDSACFSVKYPDAATKLSASPPTEWPAAIDDRKRMAAAYMARGNAHEDCSQFQLAILDFQAGADGDPTEATYHFVLGDAFVRAAIDENANGSRDSAAEFHAKAVSELEKARALTATSGRTADYLKYLYGDLGTAYLGKGDFTQAVTALHAALEALGPSTDDQSRQARCRWLLRLGQAQLETAAAADARESFRSAADAQPNCPDVGFWQGMSEVALQNYDVGIGLIEKQLAFSAGYRPRDRAMLMTGLGHAYQLRGRVGDAREARRLYNEALSLDPSSSAAKLAASLPAPTAAPVFSAPTLLDMDPVDERSPPQLCSAVARNAFLQSITDQVHAAYTTNVSRLNAYVTTLGDLMSRYWNDPTLTYDEKKAYVAVISAEHDRASAQSTAIADHDKAIIGPFYAKIENAPVAHC